MLLARLKDSCIVLCTLFEIPLVSLALRIVGFGRLYRFLLRFRSLHRKETPPAQLALPQARRTSDLVMRATRGIWPFRVTCLRESLILWSSLLARGFQAELKLGVRRAGGSLHSHAWVECQGVPLNDSPDVSREFEPFDLTPAQRSRSR